MLADVLPTVFIQSPWTGCQVEYRLRSEIHETSSKPAVVWRRFGVGVGVGVGDDRAGRAVSALMLGETPLYA
jgi:hypothetical protein